MNDRSDKAPASVEKFISMLDDFAYQPDARQKLIELYRSLQAEVRRNPGAEDVSEKRVSQVFTERARRRGVKQAIHDPLRVYGVMRMIKILLKYLPDPNDPRPEEPLRKPKPRG